MNKQNKNLIGNLIKDIKKGMKSAQFDPNGSYTGLPIDEKKPVQDQDDL